MFSENFLMFDIHPYIFHVQKGFSDCTLSITFPIFQHFSKVFCKFSVKVII